MKKLILSTLTALSLSLSVAVVPAFAASTVAGDRSATLLQQQGSFAGGGN